MVVSARIGVNSLAFDPLSAGGVWTYLWNLLRELPTLDDTTHYTLFTNRENAGAFDTQGATNVRQIACPVTMTRRLSRFAYEWGFLPVRARQEKIGVLFSPFFTSPFRLGYKSVLTVHDVLYKDFPEQFASLEQSFFNTVFDSTVRSATHILTVSDDAKRRIVHAYRLPPERITVAHLAASPVYFTRVDREAIDRVREKYGVHTPYILSVTALRAHKNLEVLIDAFDALRRTFATPITLVLVGLRHTAEGAVTARIRALGLEEEVILTGYVPDSDLPALYQGARAFVLPSRYEGFGLPVLEAMASGVPVLTTTATALPEVAGEAALFFDPDDRGALVAGLRRVLGDEGLRREMVERGRERARQFTWRKSAEVTLAAFQRAMLTHSAGHVSGHTRS